MDKRSLTSAENGRKGGRKKGYASIEAEKARNLIAEKLGKELIPIVEKAIDQAKEGDKYAREWLSDRAYGKATQFLATDPDNPLIIEGVSIKICKK